MGQRDNTNKLEQQTLKNYQTSINYYAQRKAFFLQKMVKKKDKENKELLNNLGINLKNSIEKKIIWQWNKIKNTVLSAAIINNKSRFKSYTIDESKLIEIPDDLKQILIQKQNIVDIYSLLGLYYEEYICNLLSSISQQKIQNGIMKIMSNFTKTGQLTSKSFMRKGVVDIRPDLGWGFSKNIQNNIVTDEQDNLPAEFQIDMNLQENNIEIDIDGNSNNTIIQKYLKTGMFGISVKLWSSVRNQSFTSISGLQDKLQNIYSTKRPWNITYAMQQANLTVSNYLLDIIGPTNIAVMSGQNFIWVDEFLQNNLFYMNIYAKNNRYYKNKGIANEIKPEVRDNNVYIRKFAISKMKNIISSTKVLENNEYRISFRVKQKN